MTRRDPYKVIHRGSGYPLRDLVDLPSESEALKARRFVVMTRIGFWTGVAVLVGWLGSLLTPAILTGLFQMLLCLVGFVVLFFAACAIEVLVKSYKKRMDVVKLARKHGVVEDE